MQKPEQRTGTALPTFSRPKQFTFQVEAAFKKFDQTGNDKLNFREFRDMMTKRTENKAKESEPENVPDPQQ